MQVTIRLSTTLALALTASCLGACGSSVPPPNDQWSAAQVEVGRAQSGGALDVPDAKLHLQLAQEDLEKSKGLIGNDNQRATTLVDLARAEAQLALSLAKQSAAERTARAADEELRKGGAK